MTVQDQIVAAALRYGVDPALALSVAQQESGFRQSARGSSGEVGIFQLMPATASGLGVNPYDEAQNIDGGVRYLSRQLSRFGSADVALAAYNCGPSCASSGSIPSSTRQYVQSVLATIPLYSSYSLSPEPSQGAPSWSWSSLFDQDGGGAYPPEEAPVGGIGGNETTLLVLAALAAAALLA